jgi:hypothetical protein
VIRWIWAFIDRPLDRLGQAGAFWTTVTGSRLSPLRGSDHEFATVLPGSGEAALKLQGVHDRGGAHLDLEVDDVPAAIETARRLGATVVGSKPVSEVMRSPGGQLFCVEPWDGAVSRPAVFVSPDGITSRLDQVCLDIAPALYDVEMEFWSAFTGWELHPSARPEFNLLRPPQGLPIRILLQRLDSDRASSAHVDLACSDIEATRVWHEQLGAVEVGRGPHWIVMEDPAGGTYCLTARDPQTSRPRGSARSKVGPPPSRVTGDGR